ncbi:MAG: histone deacetylase family protein, partial [Gammaproteobacteria bacterium]|nr:histone deacetylase family protein [Gammaproteobacteria bacterium]
AYALVRPPGHHAGRECYGGYCLINHAALAAELLTDAGKVAILDVDYHHGNGTQDIFWERDDVLYVSLHCRPEEAYPYIAGT